MKRGRDLERLVHSLEAMFSSGSDVVVTSPDHVQGKISGERRELDVTLRGKVGSASVLVLLECRDRKHGAGVEWIEQLASKRDDVGADHVIAVSTGPFSKAAKRMASLCGVELRRMEEVKSSECFPFLGEKWNTFFAVNQSELRGIVLNYRDRSTCNRFQAKLSAEEVQDHPWKLAVGRRTQVITGPLQLILDDANNAVWQGVSVEEWRRTTIEVAFKSEDNVMLVNEGQRFAVTSIEYEVGLRIRMVPANHRPTRAYVDSGGKIVGGVRACDAEADGYQLQSQIAFPADGSKYWARTSMRKTNKSAKTPSGMSSK